MYTAEIPAEHNSTRKNIFRSMADKMYIGLTSQSIRQRFNAHRSASTTKLQIPLYRHFSRRSHDFKRDHRIVPL